MSKSEADAPRHIEKAVALQYDPGQSTAPVLVAKGAGELAKKIIALANEHHVAVTQDADLVQLLMALEVGDQIPPEMYQAVAMVLGYVYRKNRELLQAKL